MSTYRTTPAKNGNNGKPAVDPFLRISLQITAPLNIWTYVKPAAAVAIISPYGFKIADNASILERFQFRLRRICKKWDYCRQRTETG